MAEQESFSPAIKKKQKQKKNILIVLKQNVIYIYLKNLENIVLFQLISYYNAINIPAN